MQTDEYAKMRSMEDHYWWFVSRRRLAKTLLKRFAPEFRKVLDLGCGTGAMMSELSQMADVYGLDFSDQAVSFCRERGLTHLVNANAEAIPFADDQFDAIVSLDTLEHVPNDVDAAREIERILAPGGVLVMNVPAYRWLWGPHDVALMHQRRYVTRSARALLEGAGLQVEFISYSVFFLFPIVILIRLLDKLKSGKAEVKLPMVPSFMNKILSILQDIETWLLMIMPLPWGSSVVAVARKKK